MPISSYVIRCADKSQVDVLARLSTMPDVTVGEPTPEGIPVATHTTSTREALALGEQLETLSDVVSATLVYHNFEDLETEPH